MAQGKLFPLFLPEEAESAVVFFPREGVWDGGSYVLVHTGGIAIGPSGNIRIVCGEVGDALLIWLEDLLGLVVESVKSCDCVIRARFSGVCIGEEDLKGFLASLCSCWVGSKGFSSGNLYTSGGVFQKRVEGFQVFMDDLFAQIETGMGGPVALRWKLCAEHVDDAFLVNRCVEEYIRSLTDPLDGIE